MSNRIVGGGDILPKRVVTVLKEFLFSHRTASVEAVQRRKPQPLVRSRPTMMRLEPRLMFDGAAVDSAFDTLHIDLPPSS
ncbi:MAG: hypothetical protein HQL49_03680 [Gammaproteobacteria bacterium]|nr:hypothetical protein [Gammaproteobacteria bacterium]